MLFIGSYNNKSMIAAIGLGNLMINALGLSFFIGLNTTLDTLVSQAYGNRNLKLCGNYLHRARLFSVAFYIVITMLFALHAD